MRMKDRYRELRLTQLEKLLSSISSLHINRPQRGWIETIRSLRKITLRELAPKVGVSYQTIAKLEQSEAEDRITLKRLRELGAALDCELVYALVPKQGKIRDLVEGKVRDEISKHVKAVEHTMALEGQAVGDDLEKKIEDETQRALEMKSKPQSKAGKRKKS
jgi:predicted DNA-binding mobile mystery protein A